MPEPDDSWLVAKMSVKKDNGIWLDVEMIRPAAFWHRAGAFAGGQIILTFAEIEISNLAKIHSLEPTPPIAIGVRIDQTIPRSGNALRPDLFFPNLGGRRVIFDVVGPSKIGDILKYEGMADVLIPLVPVQWIR